MADKCSCISLRSYQGHNEELILRNGSFTVIQSSKVARFWGDTWKWFLLWYFGWVDGTCLFLLPWDCFPAVKQGSSSLHLSQSPSFAACEYKSLYEFLMVTSATLEIPVSTNTLVNIHNTIPVERTPTTSMFGVFWVNMFQEQATSELELVLTNLNLYKKHHVLRTKTCYSSKEIITSTVWI